MSKVHPDIACIFLFTGLATKGGEDFILASYH